MNISDSRLAGLRRYHADRPARTRAKLLQALDRMERNQTVVVRPGFRWSKTTLAREAGININTVVRKLPGGAWAFPEVNTRFENLGKRRQRAASVEDPRKETILKLQRELKELQEQNRLFALEVNRLGQQILQEGDRVDQMTTMRNKTR